MRVFLDTNVLISAVATRGLCADILRVVLAEHDLLISDTVLDELQDVLQRKLQLPDNTAKELNRFLRHHGTRVGKGASPTVKVRDASDALILAEAIAGGADVLVTGDRDLLDIAADAPVPILSPRGLWNKLRSAE